MIYDRSKPLLTSGSIAWLDTNLSPDMIGVEYGGGGSTVWLLERLKELFTIEAQPEWAIHIIQKVSKNQLLLDKWRLYFIKCCWQIDDFGNRWNTKSPMSDENRELMEQRYCMFSAPADFILVDGSVRYLSLKVALRMLQPNGILCIDNMEHPVRQRYVAELVPNDWQRLDFKENEKSEHYKASRHQGEWITSIWIAK